MLRRPLSTLAFKPTKLCRSIQTGSGMKRGGSLCMVRRQPSSSGWYWCQHLRMRGATAFLTGTAVDQRVSFLASCRTLSSATGKGPDKIVELSNEDTRGIQHALKLKDSIQPLLEKEQWAEAASLLEELAELNKKIEHTFKNFEETQVATLCPLAWCYVDLRRWDEAETMVEECQRLQSLQRERHGNLLDSEVQQIKELKDLIQELKRDFPLENKSKK